MKKLLKILVGLLVILFVLFVVALLIVGAHLGDIAKAAINDYGPKVTQTPVSVDTVSVSLLGGSAGVKGLLVGNPQGYTAPQCLTLSNAVVSLVPGSLTSDKIVVRSIEVRGLEVSFEGNPLGVNNLTKLMANVDSASNSSSPTTNTTVSPTNPAKPAKKFEVDSLVISGVKVDATISIPGVISQQVNLPIPDIQMSNLGTDPNGITAADLTKKILSQITVDTLKSLITYVGSMGKDLGNAAKGAAQQLLQGTGALGTDGVDQIKKGIGNLFGK
jgi:hypothetical protein